MTVGTLRWTILAQAAEDVFGQVLPWLIILIGVVVLGGAGIYFVRRMLQGGPDTSNESFTLHDLRQMHQTGRLSDEEFERARAQIIGRVHESPVSGSAIAPEDDEGDLHV